MSESPTAFELAKAILEIEPDTPLKAQIIEDRAQSIRDYARSKCAEQRDADKKAVVEFIPKWLRENGMSTTWDEDTMLMDYHKHVKDNSLVI